MRSISTSWPAGPPRCNAQIFSLPLLIMVWKCLQKKAALTFLTFILCCGSFPVLYKFLQAGTIFAGSETCRALSLWGHVLNCEHLFVGVCVEAVVVHQALIVRYELAYKGSAPPATTSQVSNSPAGRSSQGMDHRQLFLHLQQNRLNGSYKSPARFTRRLGGQIDRPIGPHYPRISHSWSR